MVKNKVLIIKTGGTIAQKPDLDGIMHPSSEEYIHLVLGLEQIADFDIINLGSIDSTNMETNINFGLQQQSSEQERTIDRADIAKVIFKNAPNYDGFVVIHGTDTMAETAAALTYMVQNLGKPIVLTGAQLPIWNPRTDAVNNIYAAVQAATMDIGEVVIAFGNYLLRGTRAKKVNEDSFDAFWTYGVEPLGAVTWLEQGIKLKEHIIRRGNPDPHLFTDFDTKIFHYNHISGATVDEDLFYLAQSKHNHAIVLGSFGAGDLPDRMAEFIRKAVENEKPVFVYTRCETGAADMGIYSVSDTLLKAGAKSAGDMTLEALGQKLMYALGKTTADGLKGEKRINSIEEIIKMQYNGDITVTERRK